MIVNSESFSNMFKLDNNMILFSAEFQPYVVLEDILDVKFSDVLKAKNTIVPDEQGETKSEQFDKDIPLIENIKAEIKEEQFSENIVDIATNEITNEDFLFLEEPQDVNTCQARPESVESQKSSETLNEHLISIKEEKSESCSILSNFQPSVGIKTAPDTVVHSNSDEWSLDLHLSPDSNADQDNTFCQDEGGICSTTTERTSKYVNSSSDTSPSQSDSFTDLSNSSEEISPDQQCSPDLFEESPSSSLQESTLTRPSCSSTNPSESSDPNHSGEEFRERQEEWNSQELSLVSQTLRMRSKQAKRLILEVIRKRQMADETLEAFKKRLRRM